MLQYVLLLLRRQRGRNVLTGGGFLLAACAIILLSATTQTTVIQARQIINHNWRPSYDLVVLPPQATLPSGHAVPADFLEGYNGGISIQQYEQIKSLPDPDIAVAAPIAFLGYALSPVPDLQFAPHGLAPGYYQENLSLTAFNGHQHIIERHENNIYRVFTTCAITSETSALDSLSQQNVQVGSCGDPNASPTEFPSLDDGTFLLAAIDPAEEEQLLHLNPHAIAGRMLAEQDGLTLAQKVTGTPGNEFDYTVPMVINTSLPGNIALDATLTRLAGPLDPQQVLDSGGYSYLVHLPHQQTLFQGSVPLLQNNPQAFASATLAWNGQRWQTGKYIHNPGGGDNLLFLYTSSGLTYQPTPAPGGQVGYTLVPSQTQSPASILHALQLVPPLVYIPGLTKGQDGSTKDIPPVGWVQERWIAIGAGIVYLNQLGETQLLLLGAVLLVCLGYLVVTMSSLVSAQRRELAVLSALGWRPWHPAGMFLAQALALALCGGVVGIGLALAVVALIGASPPWQIVVWAVPAVLALALLSACYPLWTIWRIQPAEVLRAGTTVTKESTTSRINRWNASFWSRLPAVGGMALRNLSRSRGRAIIAIGSLFLSAILLTVMVDGILAFRQTLQGTLLGDYVLLQTAVPQIAGAVFAILLTFLSVADLLLLQVHERQKEIGLLQAVGWRAKVVQRLFVQEGMTLAVIGAVPGAIVALIVLMARHAAQGVVPAPLVGLGAVVLMLIVAALATIPAIRAVNRLPMMDVLRGE